MNLTDKQKCRFIQKIRLGVGKECWEWMATTNNKGYGMVKICGKYHSAHRVSWRIFCGEIPSGLHVLHRCDNTACVSPSHLFLGTHQENMADMNRKGRHWHKVNSDDVKEICRLRASGVARYKVAEKYNITANYVTMLVANMAIRPKA